MISVILTVFIGGAMGGIMREFLILGVGKLHDGFPLDIFAANVVAPFLLGWITGLRARDRVSDDVSMLVGTGLTGGLSSFSSLVYAVVAMVAMTPRHWPVAVVYLIASLVAGYLAVWSGLKLGAAHPRSHSGHHAPA